MNMATRTELLDAVLGIGEDAAALLDIARHKASSDASLTGSELRRIAALVRRAEQAMSEASALAKARRAAEIEEIEARIRDIELSLAAPLDPETVEFLVRKRRNLRARLFDKQARVALDFGGILSASEVGEIQALLAEAKQAVARRRKAARFIKNLFQLVELSGSIVRRAQGLF
jgi:hypothetical protein